MASTDENKEGVNNIVADHYNKITEDGLDLRNSSRIYHQRNFNNWIKSTIIREFTQKIKARQFDPKINVLDIGCGKGGDLIKWHKGEINHLVCADIAEVAIEKCKERYQENVVARNPNRPVFSAEFITADCTQARLRDHYKDGNMMFDIVSVQFSFHYCFESLRQTETMLQNISENLNEGGYFIATTVDCYELMKRLKSSSGLSFGNDVYSITFDQKETLPLFGAKYHFHLEGVVDCPEYLVNFTLLVELAKKYKLKLLYRKKFEDYFKENKGSYEGGQLLTRMTALETYPPMHGKSLCGNVETDYVDVEKRCKELMQQDRDQRLPHVGTLSQAEWEVISIYVVIAFTKE